MITVVVIALTAGAALGVACSALYVARGQAVGWLVVQHREPERVWQPPPFPVIGAENLAGSGVSGLAQPPRSGAAGGLDSTGAAWTIEGRPGTGYPQITRSDHGAVQR